MDIPGVGATFDPVAGVYDNIAAGGSVGVVNAGGTLFQDLGVSIAAGASYTVGGLVGNRNDYAPFAGTVAFFAGSPSTVIGEMSFATPASQGMLEGFTNVVGSSLFANYVGQTLGVIFTSTIGQVTLDDLYVNAQSPFQIDDTSFVAPQIETPLPAAIYLFGAGVAGIGFASRRRRPA